MKSRFLASLALAAGCLTSTIALAGPLRGGAAKVDVTPTPDVLPALVHDPIFVRSLVLENGKDRIVLVSVDSPGLGKTDELLDALSKEFKIPRDHIMLSATHDHSAPFMAFPGVPYPYFDQVKKGMIEAVRQSIGRLQPAKIGYRTGKAFINAHRDVKIAGRYTQGFAPEGPSDKTVAVLTVADLAGKPIAVYANYAVHGVVMFFSKTKDGKSEISGDIPGATSRYVEDYLGNNVVALWTSGAAGDQNPEYTSVQLTPENTFIDAGAGGWTLLDVQSRRLGQEIVRVVGDTREFTDNAPFRVSASALVCPGQQPKPGAKPTVPTATWETPKLEMVDANPVKIPLTMMTIGDIALAGVGGELYSEIGMAVKAQSPFDRTMVVTHLPDSVGYIPTDRAYALPSEKAATAAMKPGCAEPGIPATFKELGTGLLAQPKTGK